MVTLPKTCRAYRVLGSVLIQLFADECALSEDRTLHWISLRPWKRRLSLIFDWLVEVLGRK